MSIRQNFNLSAYLVIGPESTSRPVDEVVFDAVRAGFTFVQIRSKVASARELVEISRKSAEKIFELGKSDEVALVINDRLDIVLAARESGIKIDGIHVGQNDIPVKVCRKYLGENSIVGLSAPTSKLIDYVKNADVSDIDYFGAAPLHETESKKDLEQSADGKIITVDFEKFSFLAKISPIPVVIGGGVKLKDLPELKKTGVDGFFVISAVTDAADTFKAAKDLVNEWTGIGD